MDAAAVRDYLLGLQARIVAAFEAEGGDAFVRDAWQREPGGKLEGDGISRLVEGGALLERGGCGFSHVKGTALPRLGDAAPRRRARRRAVRGDGRLARLPSAQSVRADGAHERAHAGGTARRRREPVVWFGGGMDLTPYYGFEEDARPLPRACRDALAPFGADKYPRFKRWCDEYFFLKHRDEPRGIGGIFFDDFSRRRLRATASP